MAFFEANKLFETNIQIQILAFISLNKKGNRVVGKNNLELNKLNCHFCFIYFHQQKYILWILPTYRMNKNKVEI